MTIIKRADLGRPLTWDELDDNFQQVDNLTATASAAVSSASASATAAATSATASANSANNALSFAADASASATVAINALMNSTFEPSDFDFASGGTLDSTDRNKAVYSHADNNWYSWAGTLPHVVTAGTDPTTDSNWKPRTDQLLRQNLGSYNGLNLIGQFPTLDAMRACPVLELNQQVSLAEHTAGQGMGGGIWFCYSLTSDSSDKDDNGCQIITSSGQILRRKGVQYLYTSDFGIMDGGDLSSVLNNMYTASRTFNIEQAFIHKPSPGSHFKLDGGLTSFDISDGIGFMVEGIGVGQFGPRILHRGSGIGMRIHKDYATASQFWVSGGFKKLLIVGVDDTWQTGNMNTDAIALQASDMWAATFEDIFAFGYEANSQGAVISLYNDTAWTEGAIVKNVIVRGAVVGVWMHRNPAAGSTATDSFYRSRIELEMNAGVSSAVTMIKVGDGTEAGKCFLYGHDITITGWMSRSSWHTGINITDYCLCNQGTVRFIFDGYGIGSSATVEVLHLIRCTGKNARFDCDVINHSGQSNSYPLSMLQLIWNTCLYTLEPTALEASRLRGKPNIRPRGMVMAFNGTFTQAQCISGMQYTLNGLLPNQRLKVRLNTWANNSNDQGISQEWVVSVRDVNFATTVSPVVPTSPSLQQTSGTVGSDTFLKTSVIVDRKFVSGIGVSSLTLSNGQTDNNTGYVVNGGRKLIISLPANAAATQDMPYNVEIEIL